MNNDHEPILAALLAHLENAVVINFTGTATAGSPIITDVDNFTGLFVGLPVFGPGVPRGAVIATFDVGVSVTLNQPIDEDSTGAAFSTGFLTTGRRVIFWTQADLPQPALFIRHTATEDDWDSTIFAKTTIEGEIWIYSKGGEDPAEAPDISLNQLVTAIRESFKPDDWQVNRFTLGGKVFWCRIEGRSEFDPGDLDGQGKALIPFRILLP